MHACNQIKNKSFIQSGTMHHMSHSTRGRSSMLVAGRRVQPPGARPPIRKEKVGEGGKVGWAGGSLPQEASPFVAALATLRGRGGRGQVIAPTLEGIPGKGRSPEPTIPAIPSRQPASPSMHHTLPNQPIRPRTSLPARVSCFQEYEPARDQRGHHSAGLVCPSVSLFCQSF